MLCGWYSFMRRVLALKVECGIAFVLSWPTGVLNVCQVCMHYFIVSVLCSIFAVLT